MGKTRAPRFVSLLMCWFLIPAPAMALETINVVLTSKALQYVFLPIAQDRGYMKEEGIDLKIVYMQNAPGLQALTAGSVQFSGSGSSALVAISKGGAPLKTVLAVNDQVLQWVVVRPNINSIKDLKGGKIATTGVASIAAFMFRNILTKYGMDGNKDVVFVDPGPVNRLPALLSGTVDGAILSPEERYAAVDQGMKELMFIGKEVKNSWGTFARRIASSRSNRSSWPVLPEPRSKVSASCVRIVRARLQRRPSSPSWKNHWRLECMTIWLRPSPQADTSMKRPSATIWPSLNSLPKSTKSCRSKKPMTSASFGKRNRN